MSVIAVLLTIIACLLPYLSSKQQQLIKGLKWHKQGQTKGLCWLLFCFLNVAATACLSTNHTWVVAGLIVLMMTMCFWCLLSISAAHWPDRIVSVITGMALVFSSIALTGGL